MKTSLRTLFFDLCFYDALHSNGFCYNPGQRTIHLLGETLNSDKHPVHLVVTQTIDMREVLTAEAMPSCRLHSKSAPTYGIQ